MLPRQNEMAYEEDDQLPTVWRIERPAGDRSALLAKQAVGYFDRHDAIEPIGTGKLGPIGRLPNALESTGPAGPQRTDLIHRAAHRMPRKKASRQARSLAICRRLSRRVRLRPSTSRTTG